MGQGVTLGLTSYDTDARLLALSSGERYKTQEAGGNVNLQQRKLDTVRVTKDSDSYRVVHKSGDVEILAGPRKGFSLKVPTALLTPTGHSLALSWDFTTGPQPRLLEVRDETDTLLTVDYVGKSKATLNVLPGQSEGYGVELRFRNGLLAGVRHDGLGADAPLVWDFTSDSVGLQGVWGSWITGVSSPGGMSETVYYPQDGSGHQFPASAGLPALPRVTRYVRRPGGGQPQIEIDYSYTERNFLGGHSGAAWDPDRDNLYGVLTSYSYGSTESRTCDGRTTETVRSYNQYHVQTSEETRQNGCSRKVETDYYASVGTPFDRQPAQFQLPRSRTVTWTDPRHNARSETTETAFDDAGNPQSQVDPDGTRTEWTYYPASGSGSDCPPEPNGFTRLLRSVTRTPPKTGFDTPVHKVTYGYLQLRATADPRVSAAVLKSGEQHYADGRLLSARTFAYSATGTELARLTRLVETEYPSGGNGPAYAATHDFAFSVEQDALVQRHTLTSHDDLTLTRSQTRSRFTGRLLTTTDPHSNTETMTYDLLGRMTARTRNADDPRYRATDTVTYETGGSAPFVVTSTDAVGNALRESLDGLGRPIRYERKDTDGDGTWYTVRTLGYDEQGRLSSVTEADQVRGGGPLQLTQSYSYDDWGQVSVTTSGDGARHRVVTDPIQQTTTTQLLDPGTPVTGTQVTTYNTRREPVSVARFDLQGEPAGASELQRDGWGRVRSATDELGNTTRYDYDDRGRPTTTTLPDGTTITRTYAPSSPAELIETIALNRTSYGTQSFDGLGRITASTSGGRTWTHRYASPEDPLPASVTAPDQQTTSYEYIPQLDHALARVQAGAITQRYTRDPVTGYLTTAREGEVTITRDHYPSGLPRTETTALAGQADRGTQWTYTVGGLAQTYTGVDGATETVSRDDFGRVTRIDDPATQVTLTYDSAGRLTRWTAEDKQSRHTLTTALELDDFGREVKRTVTDSQGTTWTLTQRRQPNGLLSGRTLTRGAEPLRDESFSYSSRNQLLTYTCAGDSPPEDDRGNPVTRQTFTYDAYGNVTRCDSTFSSGSDTATYLYGNRADPCQLTGVRHTHASFPATTDLRYDLAGRLTTDDAGRALTYDALGRLRTAGAAAGYGYDPLDRLLTQTTDGTTSTLYYRQGQLATVIAGDRATRLLLLGPQCVAQHRTAAGQDETLLLGTDAKGTVLVSTAGHNPRELAHTAYGARPVGETGSVLGYDGQRTDPATGWYHLGNGYRAYHPALMRFNAPDSLSPFGAGGINPYAYCAGDPVNRTDPTGHLSWMAWLGIGMGVLGVGLAVFTAGASIAAAGGVMAALSAASTVELAVGAVGVVSDVTSIAGGALEEASPKASSILGWVSLGTGLAGAGIGTAAARGSSRLAAQGTAETAQGAAEAARATEDVTSETRTYSLTEHYPAQKDNLVLTGNGGRRAGGGTGARGARWPWRPRPTRDAAADRRMYHYTNAQGQQGIIDSGTLNASTMNRHARYGHGQYLTDHAQGGIVEDARKGVDWRVAKDEADSATSQILVLNPDEGARFSHWLEIDVRGLEGLRVAADRPQVFLIPNERPLDLTGRIRGWWAPL
ncbi:RHS repeat-associated core domain-containing protein [Kitasatospora sp. NPDC096140]|uniref:RHS repeat-associated core domain-containing protein n=1 Tax=Kitasatospora sp. NPDC096140 TaxID=3155425 RepID=UPI003316AA69